jgi:hypothetical protein
VPASSSSIRALLRTLAVPLLAAAFAGLYFVETADLPTESTRFPRVFVAAVIALALVCGAAGVMAWRRGAAAPPADAPLRTWVPRAFWVLIAAWAVAIPQLGFFVTSWAALSVLGVLLAPELPRTRQEWLGALARASVAAAACVAALYLLTDAAGIGLPSGVLV